VNWWLTDTKQGIINYYVDIVSENNSCSQGRNVVRFTCNAFEIWLQQKNLRYMVRQWTHILHNEISHTYPINLTFTDPYNALQHISPDYKLTKTTATTIAFHFRPHTKSQRALLCVVASNIKETWTVNLLTATAIDYVSAVSEMGSVLALVARLSYCRSTARHTGHDDWCCAVIERALATQWKNLYLPRWRTTNSSHESLGA
jgi:hypothetical protein